MRRIPTNIYQLVFIIFVKILDGTWTSKEQNYTCEEVEFGVLLGDAREELLAALTSMPFEICSSSFDSTFRAVFVVVAPSFCEFIPSALFVTRI